MDIYTTKPIEILENKRFQNIVSGKKITISAHSYDHLSEGQRKVFKDHELIGMLDKEKPRKVYLQKNGRYAAYYRRSDGYRKIIVEVNYSVVTIITFMDVYEIPKYKI